MTFKNLIMIIQEKYFVLKTCCESEENIEDIELLDSNSTHYLPTTLYMGSIVQMNPALPSPNFLIFTSNNESPIDYMLKNYIIIHEKDFASIFNLIKNELLKGLKAKQTYAQMLKMILDGKNLSTILCKIAQQVRNPIAVLDISGKILGYSTPFQVTDPLWMDSVGKGYCPYPFMAHLKQVRTTDCSHKSSESFISLCNETHMIYLCSKILVQNELLGYVFMFGCHSPIEEQSKELLPLISKMAGELLISNQSRSSIRTHMYQNLLSDMLSGIGTDHANARIQASELAFPPHMKVLTVRSIYYMDENYMKNDLQKKLLKIFGKVLYLYYQSSIIIIAGLNQLNQDSVNALENLCNSLHMLIGISNEFSQPEQFATFYNQADKALHLAQQLNSQQSLNYYKDYIFFDILYNLPKETVSIKNFCHPALHKLRSYDYEKGTELFNTLKIFTENKFNQKLTIDTLFIHRNTLNYRKQRIVELCGIDFEDSTLLFQLMYSFQIDIYITLLQENI